MTPKKVIDKIALIYIKDRKILSSRTRGRNVWYIPGGKRENSESDQDTLTREIQEELNVKIIPETVNFLDVFIEQADNHPEGVMVKMTCYTAEFLGQLSPSNEIEALDYLAFSDREKCSPVDKVIFTHLYENNLID